MSNINELKQALTETLEETGELNKIRAILREKIFKAIETDDKPKPKLSNENLIINELIRDYLKYRKICKFSYNNYLHTSSVLVAESGQPVESPFDRHFIAKELNVIINLTKDHRRFKF
jgi:lisH domain-containing protein FOPNL